MRQNSDRGNFDFRISAQSFIKENCHNSRTGDDIDMKLGPITKFGKRNKTPSKKIDDDVMSETFTSLSFFWFMANLEQSGSRIVDAYSIKLIFSLKVNFYLIKTENRTKIFLIQLSHYGFE